VVTLAVLAGGFDPMPSAESEVRSPDVATGGDAAPATCDADPDPPAPDDHAPATTFDRERDRALRELLERTELAPGQSLRGEVWFAAKPLRQLMSAESSGEGYGITAAPPHAPSDYALTLRTPDALGGQEIEYSVAAR
jgi:hypothetical protein